jgi:CubicO group peptidase (beta-lactamase class C family)
MIAPGAKAWALVALALAAPVSVPASAGEGPSACPPRSPWPAESWPSHEEAVRAERSTEIAALERYAFTRIGTDGERKGIRTDAVLIVQGGAVVFERYARGWDASHRHLTWSVTKSLTDALAGVAVHQGLLSIDDSVCKHLPSLPSSICGVTVAHLLGMASGLDWKEGYENESTQESSVLAMLYGQGRADMGRFNAGHVQRDRPGASWLYSSGDTCLLAKVIGQAMRPRFGPSFPWPALFDRIGARRVAFERDASGDFVASSYWYATARDAARLGFLYLNDGCWSGVRLLPEGWVAGSTRVGPAFKRKRYAAEPTDVYGRHWWVNVAVPEANIPKPFPSAPEDLYLARGHWGQSVSVIPSLDLVVVRFADDREAGAFDLNRFLELAIAVGKAP